MHDDKRSLIAEGEVVCSLTLVAKCRIVEYDKVETVFLIPYIGLPTGGIIWEVEGRGSGSKGVAYHTDSPTQVEDLGRYRSTFFPFSH